MPDGIQLVPTQQAQTEEVRPLLDGRMEYLGGMFKAHVSAAQAVQEVGRIVQSYAGKKQAEEDKKKEQQRRARNQADISNARAYETRSYGQMQREIEASPNDPNASTKAHKAHESRMNGYTYGTDAQGVQNLRDPETMDQWTQHRKLRYEQEYNDVAMRKQQADQHLTANRADIAMMDTLQGVNRGSVSREDAYVRGEDGITIKVGAGALTPEQGRLELREYWNKVSMSHYAGRLNRLSTEGMAMVNEGGETAPRTADARDAEWDAALKEVVKEVEEDLTLTDDQKTGLMGQGLSLRSQVSARAAAKAKEAEATRLALRREETERLNSSIASATITLRDRPQALTELTDVIAGAETLSAEEMRAAYSFVERVASEPAEKKKPATPAETMGVYQKVGAYNAADDAEGTQSLLLTTEIADLNTSTEVKSVLFDKLKKKKEALNPDRSIADRQKEQWRDYAENALDLRKKQGQYPSDSAGRTGMKVEERITLLNTINKEIEETIDAGREWDPNNNPVLKNIKNQKLLRDLLIGARATTSPSKSKGTTYRIEGKDGKFYLVTQEELDEMERQRRGNSK